MSTPELEMTYTTVDDENRGENARTAIHRRRKAAMAAILAEFEKLESSLPPGHEDDIRNFKGVCRKQINRLAYEGIRAAAALPGEALSTTTADLAADLAFDDQEENETT